MDCMSGRSSDFPKDISFTIKKNAARPALRAGLAAFFLIGKCSFFCRIKTAEGGNACFEGRNQLAF